MFRVFFYIQDEEDQDLPVEATAKGQTADVQQDEEPRTGDEGENKVHEEQPHEDLLPGRQPPLNMLPWSEWNYQALSDISYIYIYV